MGERLKITVRVVVVAKFTDNFSGKGIGSVTRN